MKIQFYCNKCDERFNVSDKYLILKDSIICPNCSSQFDETSFLLLKDGVQKICDSREKNPHVDVNHNYCELINFKIID
ncbi:hypothetical protein [Clostridium butyricum]|uniref:hypothetical protein n=1 Tax=Clostridium butyricum TaxID=1492 RepID=UPI0002D1E9B3|nr:hypothetical protein [Clostridium butyricum]ENZ33299.1 hypothetical protein HMPREF1084_01767 [Clostridium butyricum 60E.3]MDU1340535.1 hypothetical protein [Clostridium butyricum]MDU5104794.1 hypothetical protein [Clostridium butyricum]DAJ73811.1 MAG TPA: Transcription initiation factor IIE, alpha FINGER, Transcription [Caudoviricetes sp.]